MRICIDSCVFIQAAGGGDRYAARLIDLTSVRDNVSDVILNAHQISRHTKAFLRVKNLYDGRLKLRYEEILHAHKV